MPPKKSLGATPRSVSPPLSPRRSVRKTAAPRPVSPVPLPPSPKPRATKPVKEVAAKKVAGWHSTTGGAPSIRGNTKLARFAALFGVCALILLTGPTAYLNVHVMINKGGHLSELLRDGPGELLRTVPRPNYTGRAAQLLGCYAVFEALLLVFMPGKKFIGPVTAGGNRPVYKANGFQCFIATFVAYFAALKLDLFRPSEVYDLFPQMIVNLSVFSIFFCWFLYFKGKYAPSSSDSGSGGNLLMDYFWGMELYPRLFWGSLDVKTFTNCRFGMMGWAVLIVTFALTQHERNPAGVTDAMLVCVTLMMAYVAKFFLWETGYWGSMDIMHDRAGYMICWGCLTWVPAIYTAPALFLVNRTHTLGTPLAVSILVAGAAAVWINFDSDRQRQHVRATDGKASVWGRPASVIRASYVTAKGEKRSSLLLCSGWWGVARHFHYVPELLAAFLWTAPCGFTLLPYFYFVFLTILLVDRAARDDKRCASKYTSAWKDYCAKVPYRMIPFVY